MRVLEILQGVEAFVFLRVEFREIVLLQVSKAIVFLGTLFALAARSHIILDVQGNFFKLELGDLRLPLEFGVALAASQILRQAQVFVDRRLDCFLAF